MNEQTDQNNSTAQQEKTIPSHYDYADVTSWIEKKVRNYTAHISKSWKATIPSFTASLPIF
ncbi:MAG: hypothetical protein M0D53_00815 [Flavobacterium sp. JAD_PAG50586_2]|nr:MAG: hypothetical protein M0D53_00815 [Flavobacterium sp. JAD_PAG50586_2]